MGRNDKVTLDDLVNSFFVLCLFGVWIPGGRQAWAWLAASVLLMILRARSAPKRRQRRIAAITQLDALLRLSPSGFEAEVANLLEHLGFTHVRVNGGAGDLQADIICVDPDGLRTVVQCKRYGPNNRVSSPTLQTFIGMARVHHQSHRAIFVTTSSFTGPARQLGQRHGVELWGGTDLVGLFMEAAAGLGDAA